LRRFISTVGACSR